MSASIWNPGTTLQAATGTGVVSEVQYPANGQSVISIASFTYLVGMRAVSVYLNGVKQVLLADYTESSPSSITLVNPASIGDVIDIIGVVSSVNLNTQTYSQVEQDIASATTTDIGAVRASFLRITGTTNINSFGLNFYGPIFIRFASSLTLTNSATLVLPGGANLIVSSGTNIIATPKASGGVQDGWIVRI